MKHKYHDLNKEAIRLMARAGKARPGANKIATIAACKFLRDHYPKLSLDTRVSAEVCGYRQASRRVMLGLNECYYQAHQDWLKKYYDID